MIKTFRGILNDGQQETIRLTTNDGKTGYRIKKFQGIGAQPSAGGDAGEHFLFLWSYEQTAVSTTTAVTDFSNSELLGVCWVPNNVERPFASAIIFDSMTFNQDIYITHTNNSGSVACNYYVELEQVLLSEHEAAISTLKDMRGSP